MGQPVRIVDLARNLIRLAGLDPEKDVKISFTGLRPGEKLYEELITEGENILPTYHKKIKIFLAPAPDRAAIATWVQELRVLVEENDAAGVVTHLARLIPEYSMSPAWLDASTTRAHKMPGIAGSATRRSFRAVV
jgi:FlaA1/EpsC-like NDP-sugar epimerase